MTKEEIRLLALEEELKQAKTDWGKALDDVEKKGSAQWDDPYHKAEVEARHKVMRLEDKYREAKEAATPGIITDDEVERIASLCAGGGSVGAETSDDGKGLFYDRILDNI